MSDLTDHAMTTAAKGTTNTKNNWQLNALTEALGDLSLTVTDSLSVGRGSDNDVVLGSKQVSRNHALLSVLNGALYVKDLDSSNGTFVNDDRIDGNKSKLLKANDTIGFASFVFQVATGIASDNVEQPIVTDAEVVDANIIDAEVVDSVVLNSTLIDAETVDIEVVNTEVADAIVIDSGMMNEDSIDTEIVDAEIIDAEVIEPDFTKTEVIEAEVITESSSNEALNIVDEFEETVDSQPSIHSPVEPIVVEETVLDNAIIEDSNADNVLVETTTEDTVIYSTSADTGIIEEAVIEEAGVEEPVIKETIIKDVLSSITPVEIAPIAQEPATAAPLISTPVINEVIEKEPDFYKEPTLQPELKTAPLVTPEHDKTTKTALQEEADPDILRAKQAATGQLSGTTNLEQHRDVGTQGNNAMQQALNNPATIEPLENEPLEKKPSGGWFIWVFIAIIIIGLALWLFNMGAA